MKRKRFILEQIQTEKNQYKPFGITVLGGNGQGHELNQLSYAEGICIDNNKSVYIADYWNDLIVQWKLNSNTGQITAGDEKGELVAGGNGEGNSLRQLSHPQGVIVDHLGQIYVADRGNHRVMRSREGDEEGEGNQSNQLNSPKGLSFDNEENLYVVDGSNHRIQKYEKILD
ncbi:unnamed protein product [Adineta steineri]|uniref:NHL repeat containing protein n=1 Tax=Adineta steineri TaxID=433720 RepID=A0A815JQC9_9BILA|nr:unnamed protein product [Adineta steineri]CAF1455263.1 unnamed protein product [Adineta steineri]CAF1456498.1 unnamed protein product [Adineta steineri]CAF1583132.1 unnamed protein product [Adineta steineri]